MTTPSIKSLIQLTAVLSSMAFLGITQAQSVISNVYPNGANLFQPSPTLTFTASSPAGISNVTVGLTVKSLYTGQSFLKNLSAAHGLTITGPATSLSVSAALTSNTLYSAIINIADTNGNTANQTVTFDTIAPSFTWEAEDWDYTDTNTSTSGLFIDNPQTNAYRGLATTVEASNNNGPGAYRPSVPGLSTENASDIPRLPYIGTGMTDYDVGWTDGGEFGNYTRHYPAGTYNLFARASGGNGARTESTDITVLSGTAVISGTGPYKFGVLGRGWQSYDFMPVTDSGGNLIQITFDGSVSTLQEVQNQASDNINFYMLMPLNTNAQVTTVTITNIYPDGAFQFQATNELSFAAASTVGGINPSDITVQLTATALSGQGYVTNYTTANGLIVTGDDTNISVTAPLASNTAYTAFIQVNDAGGIPASATISFDTITPAYTWEAEDWDYSGGQFFDNPQTNAYAGLDGGITDIDQHCPNNVHSYSYRGGALLNFGLNNESAGDAPRMSHLGFQDYDVGFTSGGNWGNYTRHFPAGIYNIYVRASRGDGGNVTDAGSISLVTSGYQTTNQTTSQIGTYNVASTGNWQKYRWFPVKDTGGSLARFTTDGSMKTLRVTIDGGGHNQNFFLLSQADLSMNPPPTVNNFQPDGSSIFQPSNMMSFVANSSVGITTNHVVVTLDGTNDSNLSFTGSSSSWNVSGPVTTNTLHTVVITLTDPAGTTSYTNTFATFSANNYQWEAEDYDYTNNSGSGQFFDNPQVNSYAGLGGASGIDFVESDQNAFGRGYVYRPSDVFGFPDTTSGDGARPQYTAISATDYSIGSFGPHSWANYTRHYPLGTYNVVGRFAEGAALSQAMLSVLTSGYATSNQTTRLLGAFSVPVKGWSTWEWATLNDGGGNPVKVTFDGSQTTLQLDGSPADSQPEVNVNFLMLVPTTPAPKLTASRNGGNVMISFVTQSGYSYQVQYKTNLTDATWLSLGAALLGNNTIQSASDPTTGASRFYRVKIQ